MTNDRGTGDGVPERDDTHVQDFLRAAARADGEGAPLAAGSFAGNYRIVNMLGRGGMGVVYEAEHAVLHRRVALKVLPDVLSRDETRRRRFLREARLASALSHPSVAAVYEAGADGDCLFLAMELVDGKTLRQLMDEGPLELPEICRIGRDIARALAAACEKNIIHRDIKPDNVMSAVDGAVKVLDFGIAKVGTELPGDGPTESVHPTAEGHILGTPSYMSPEQARGLLVDSRTDIFSLGVTLYELCTGLRPFDGETSMETLISITRDEAPPPSRLRKDIPAALEVLILQCLAKQPPLRPSAADVAKTLDALARGERPRVARRGRRWMLAAAVGALGAATAAWLLAQPAPRTGADPAPAAVRSPLATDDSVLGCPILEARGVTAPTGWLGAAAADYACRRAMWLLGGRDERTLGPADLLDLPRQPSHELPRDPFTEADARERSLEAARRRASVVLDGSIERREGTFQVELRAETTDGVAIATATAGAPLFEDAVSRALETLGAGIPRAEALCADARRWWTVDSIDVALHIDDLVNLSLAPDERCPRLGQYREALRMLGPEIDSFCRPETPRPAIDLASLPAVALAAIQVPEGEIERTRARLGAARASEPSKLGQARLAVGEGFLLMRTAKNEEARNLFLYAVSRRPRDPAAWWGMLLAAGQTSTETSGIIRAMRAWLPYEADVWAPLFGLQPSEKDFAIERRGVELAPDGIVLAAKYAEQLVSRGGFDEARAIAADWAARGAAFVSDYVLALIEVEQARFGAALEHLRASYRGGSETFVMERSTYLALELGEATGLLRGVVDGWIEGVILAEPTRLHGSIAGAAIAVCLRADGERARTCVERARRAASERAVPLDWLGTALDAAERRLAGDKAGAVKLLRPLLTSIVARVVPPDLFDGEDDGATASKLDELVAKRFAGVSLADVRAARRAARVDKSRASALARKILDAWAKADTELPVLVEMRALAK